MVCATSAARRATLLACGHGVHRACVSNAIDEGKPEDVLCPVCGVSAFPGLRRKPRRPRPEAPPSQPQAVAAFGSVVERSAFDVPRSPPPGPQGLEALVVGSTIGPAASTVGPPAGSLFTGSLAAASGRPAGSLVGSLAATSLLETGSVFTLSNAAPMSPSSRAALAVAQRSPARGARKERPRGTGGSGEPQRRRAAPSSWPRPRSGTPAPTRRSSGATRRARRGGARPPTGARGGGPAGRARGQ